MTLNPLLVHERRSKLVRGAIILVVATVASLTLLAIDTGPAAAQVAEPPAATDNLADAPLLVGLPVEVFSPVPGDELFASSEPDEPPCWPNNRFSNFRTVWYEWVAPTTQPVTFDASSSVADALGVYGGDGDAGMLGLALVACDDDGVSPGPFLVANVVAGSKYWIQVNVPYGGGQDLGIPLRIHPLRNNGTIDVNIEASGAELPATWTVTLTSDACAYRSTQIVTAVPGLTTATFTDLPVVNDADNSLCVYTRSMDPVDGWTNDFLTGTVQPFEGLFDAPVQTTLTRFVPTPANDDLADATPITGDVSQGGGIAVSSTLVGATFEPDETGCLGTGVRSVWYRWTASVAGSIEVASNSRGLVAVYSAPTAEPTITDLTLLTGTQCGVPTVTFPATAGETYWVQIWTTDPRYDASFDVSLRLAGQGPYAANIIPTTIEAEDFDYGAEGEAYSDSDLVNYGSIRSGISYRDTGVDIYPSRTPSGGDAEGFVIGRTRDGEWLEYTVDVDATQTFDIVARVATAVEAPGSLRLDIGDATVATVEITGTGGWWNWAEVPLGSVELQGNRSHVVRITWVADVDGVEPQINLDWLRFDAAAPGTCGGTIQQAEFARLVGDLQTVPLDNPGQISGSSIGVATAPDLANTYQLGVDNAYAEFCVTTTALDEYGINVRIQAPDTRSDSFWVQVDDGDPVLWHIGDTDVRTRIGWTEVKDSTAPDRPEVKLILEPGEHRVRLYHRESGYLLDAVQLVRSFLDPPPALPVVACSNPLHVEAEWGTVSGNMAIQPDPGATFNRYVANDLSIPSAYAYDPAGTDWVEYCVRVPEAGDWRLSATMIAPTANNNSLYVQVNGSAAEAWHPRPTDTWARRTKPGAYSLPAGDVVVRFTAREAGTLLDNFSLVPA